MWVAKALCGLSSSLVLESRIEGVFRAIFGRDFCGTPARHGAMVAELQARAKTMLEGARRGARLTKKDAGALLPCT